MRKAPATPSLRYGGAALGLALLLGAVGTGNARAEPPMAASAVTSDGVRLLIGGELTSTDDHRVVVKLGPSDADWNEPDQAIGLPLIEMRSADDRVLWSRRRAAGATAAVVGSRPSPGDSLSCLTQAVYYEARSQNLQGQQGVAQVVMNRTRAPGYGSSVCSVVYQRTGPYRTCQFTFVCDGSMDHRIEPAAWRKAEDVASRALGGFVYDPLRDALHYHATYVSPNWGLDPLLRIGDHIFYH